MIFEVYVKVIYAKWLWTNSAYFPRGEIYESSMWFLTPWYLVLAIWLRISVLYINHRQVSSILQSVLLIHCFLRTFKGQFEPSTWKSCQGCANIFNQVWNDVAMQLKTFKEFLDYLSCCCSVTTNTGNPRIYLNSNVWFANFLRSVKGQTMTDCLKLVRN